MKILFIMLSGAGDVLMATPLIKEIRKAFPKARIDALVMQNILTKELLQYNPDINNAIYFNFPKEGYINSLKFCFSLRKKYDLSITTYPQARYHYSIVSMLIGAKKRIGFNYGSQKLKLNKLFFHNLINEDFQSHVVANNLKALYFLNAKKPALPKLILKLDKQSKEFAEQFFKKNKIKKSVIIHAGSGLTKSFILKRWPIKNFAQLAKKLNKQKNYKILLIQGPEEKDINKQIIQCSGLKKDKDIFIIETDILKAAAIIKSSNLVISNDTVIGHMAAALNTKVISLFGPTSPENTAPFTNNKVIICKRPNHIEPYKHGQKGITTKQAEYMKMITPEDVFQYA